MLNNAAQSNQAHTIPCAEPLLTRFEEIILYAQKQGYKRLGLAYCSTLNAEAQLIAEALKRHFKISAVCCRPTASRQGKPRSKHHAGRQICDPQGQLKVFNSTGVEMIVALGLCIGNEIVLKKSSPVPVTTLAVQDQMFSHSPLEGFYNGYYYQKYNLSRSVEKVD